MTPGQNPVSRNILHADVEIKGNLKFTGELAFSGQLDGEIQSEGSLVVDDKAVVRGNINLNSVVLRGKVNGNVSAKDKIEIKSMCQLFGDVRASKLIIEEGATFVGKCEVNPNKIPAPSLSPMAQQPTAPSAMKFPETMIPAKK